MSRRSSREALPRRLSRRTVYRNSWLSLHVDKVRYPDGHITPEHHVVDFPEPATAALVTDARDRVLFVRAYRYVTGNSQWEIPAGRADGRESPLTTARRETREETGYETLRHKLLYSFYPVNGASNLVFHVVACRAGNRVGGLDLGEVSAIRWLSWTQIRRMIKMKKFKDGLTLTALLLALSLRSH